jgi:hypothetical protein
LTVASAARALVRLTALRPARRLDGPSAARPILAAVAVAGAVIVTNLIDFEADGLRIRLLDANLGSSWSHRATAAALLGGGALAVLRAGRAGGRRAWWGATAAALILLFVVEVSPAHVQVDRLSYGKLIYVPLLACLVLCIRRLVDGSDQVAVMWVGLVTLAGSYAVHVLGPHVVQALGWGTDSWAYQLKVGLKEGAELAGWLLLVLALWRCVPRQPGLRGGLRHRSDGSVVGQRRVVPRPPVSRKVEASPMGCSRTERT